MSKRKSTVEDRLLASMDQAVEIARGKEKPARSYARPLTARVASGSPAPKFDAERIVRMREGMQLSQPVFAQLLNVSAETVRAWEQKKRTPDGAALRLLELAEQQPKLLLSKVRPAGVVMRMTPVTAAAETASATPGRVAEEPVPRARILAVRTRSRNGNK